VTDHDIVIVGGAVMGAATAYHLSRLDPRADVVVFERDPTYARSSTVLSDGNVRVQFNLQENILISLHTLEVLETFADDMAVDGVRPDVAARHQGNLFLTDADGSRAAREGLASQRALGCEVAWLDADEVAGRWPAYAASGVVGGTFGPVDGSVDPHALLHGYRRKAMAQGVEFVADEVTALVTDSNKVTGVTLAGGRQVRSDVVVNCAGAWSPSLARTVGIDLPVIPVMRNVYVVDTMIPIEGLPSVFLPSGLYVIPERDRTFAIGWSRPDDPVGFDFVFDRSRFERLLWPELFGHMTAFEALHVASGWAGLYAVNTMDGNAIIGEWPGLTGAYVCTGFSGHGFQQAPAVGRHLAETILGLDPSLDLSRLGPQRVVDGVPLAEYRGRLI
jgi:FAD-dependent oxidoreductase domain-containing protein 1